MGRVRWRIAVLVASLFVSGFAAAGGEFASIIRANGPTRHDTTNACLLLLNDPSGSAHSADSARTQAMAMRGWGTPTNHHGVPHDVELGVSGGHLLMGEPDRCVEFGSTGRIELDDPAADFAFGVWNRFSFGFRFIADEPSDAGPAEWTVVSRINNGASLASRSDDRGWRLVLRRAADGSLRLRMWLIHDLTTDAYAWHESATPIVPGRAYSVLVAYRGTSEAASITIYLDGHRAAQELTEDGDGWWLSARNIAPEAILRLGSETGLPGTGFSGRMAGFFVQPRMLGPWDAANLHRAATAEPPAVAIPNHANLRIIREALQGRCFARVVGDSTSTPGDTSIGDLIPRRLQSDGLIPARSAHYKPFATIVRSGPPFAQASQYTVLQAPGSPWDAVPMRRGSVLTTFTSLRDLAPGEWELAITDPLADVMDTSTFPSLLARVLHPVGTGSHIPTQRMVSVSSGANLATGAISLRGDVALEYATTDIALQGPFSPADSAVVRLLGDETDETGSASACFGVWLVQGSPAARSAPGLWWGGAIALDGSTTHDHAVDGLIYEMAGVDRFDSALTEGFDSLFTHRVVFVLLTLNDLGANATASFVRDRLAAIAAKWTSRGYRVCLVQPYLPLLSSSAINLDRLPLEDVEDYWMNAFLPLAVEGSNIAAASLHRGFRGVPHQYLEGPVGPAYSLHAVDSAAALRLLIPLGDFLLEVQPPPVCAADFNRSGSITTQDVYDFLTVWSAGEPAADINGVGGVTVQDLYDFLTAWMAGC